MNKDKHYQYVEQNFPNHTHIFSNIVGDKILIYDFEIEDIGFIEFLYETFPLVLVVTNSFDKYTYAQKLLENDHFVVLQEVTNTEIISYKFDTVIMFNTLSNIKNSVFNEMPLKDIQTTKSTFRHMTMTYALVLKDFLRDVSSKMIDNGKLIINDFNFIDSDEYDVITTLTLNDNLSYLLDKYLDLRVNRNVNLQCIKFSDKFTSFVGSYQDIYGFLTTRVRIGHKLVPLHTLANEWGVSDVSRDSLMLCGSVSADSLCYLLDNMYGFKSEYTTKLSNELMEAVRVTNFEGLNRLSDVIDDDLMTIVATKTKGK